MDTRDIKKRLARSFGLAFMLAGGLLCGTAIKEALNGVPDATLSAAIYATMFSFGGILFTWSRKP